MKCVFPLTAVYVMDVSAKTLHMAIITPEFPCGEFAVVHSIIMFVFYVRCEHAVL